MEGTSFVLSTPDGRTLTSPDLVGAVLEASDETGRTLTVRIDAVRLDPSGPHRDIWLHRISARDAATGSWGELCGAAPDGTVAAFPLAGRWSPDGRHLRDDSTFAITCASGAVGKCVRFGYRPWAHVAGQSLWDHHQACVRMLRADYGGDGVPHTRNGTLIDAFDALGIQTPASEPNNLGFEAAWDAGGAVCVRRTRVPDILSLDELRKRYPRLARGAAAPGCSEATPSLLWNRS